MTDTLQRPAAFPLRIQGGMLEALGINMYATIGKCLVEFVANAYDGEATQVVISIPVDRIESARRDVRAEAKREVEQDKRDPFTVLLTPLPDDIAIVIEDDGHGMSPDDVARKFLPINRKRRVDEGTGQETRLKSENGLRHVMGRKGLGKLAGFGAANKVVIRTKREGDSFATTFTLDDALIRHAENLGQVSIPASYEDGLSVSEHGTRITLSNLKSDAVRFSTSVIAEAIRESFYGIEPEQLTIFINDEEVIATDVEYEFVYPVGAHSTQLAEGTIEVDGLTSIPISYMVGFLPRGKHLPVSKRGARIYCNGRLAAGPTMFGLPTGMHNFHSQSYMQAIIRADALDQHGVDLVNTNRSQLREDNEIVGSLIKFIEEAMRKSLAEHAKWRESDVDKQIEKSEAAKRMMRLTNTLEGKARSSTKKLLRALAIEHGADSTEFNELAPLVVESVNAGEVLIRLSELGHDPKSLQVIAINLAELAEIEKSDALKIYRGHRNGIIALLRLIEEGEEELWKIKGIENRLHALLKENPWLIQPEYARYLTSDERLANVSVAIAKHLGVDNTSKLDDATRPDLVFVLSDTSMPHRISVVELKSPSLPLNNDHLSQLETYMAKIEGYCLHQLQRQVTVHGYLIGAVPKENTTVDKELLLRTKIQKTGPDTPWMVIGVRALLERAQATHQSVIDALDKDIQNGLANDSEPSSVDGEAASMPR
jgi:hypothetical protein